MFKFNIPIGDWSDDGHGICRYYLISSNKPVEEVREAHFKIVKETGIDVTKICKNYEEDWYYDEEIIQKIIDTGFDVEKRCCEIDRDGYENLIIGITFEPRELAELWVHLLMYVDKDLKLEFVAEEETLMLSFYGFDEKKRHISFVGYGLFE
jgi:hypothetical protein